ncbi:MAG: PAS domain-containing protein [Muricomes sp.]
MSTNSSKISRLADILEAFVTGKMQLEEAKKTVESEFQKVPVEDLALAEQELTNRNIDDDTVYNNIESFLIIFKNVLQAPDLELEDWHPIRTYQRENEVVKLILKKAEELSKGKFILNQWAEVMEDLKQYDVHLSRKQNQLYPAFEKAGFDRPSKIMWTLDDKVINSLRRAAQALENADEENFLQQYREFVPAIEELLEKEDIVLFPSAMEMISDEEFLKMRAGDDEIGYCLIDTPPGAPVSAHSNKQLNGIEDSSFGAELQELLKKHGIGGQAEELDVRQGKLTLEQINLIFRHLPIDLSYVDENELVRFYSDTKHRVFPRSPGVIGRDVKNCHPRESVHNVEKIIEEFRAGREDSAEFWLEMGGKFVYILYTAVRDDNGKFRGVLEMMQDATHIRSLEGSQRLLTWENHGEKVKSGAKEEPKAIKENPYGFTPDTVIGEVVKKYPKIRSYLPEISTKYKKLQNPIAFKAMSNIATLEMVAQRGGLAVEDLIQKLTEWADTQ